MDRPFAGSRPLGVALGLVLAGVAACALHAKLSVHRLDLACEAATRHSLVAPALAAAEDLRHPGWARPEMPLAGQPALVDPRTSALVVHPPPFQVQRP